jgi:hypothetical protein
VAGSGELRREKEGGEDALDMTEMFRMVMG